MAMKIDDMAKMANDFPEEVNKMLEKMADDLDKNYDTKNDKGQDALMNDLTSLLYEAFNYEFHDYKNKNYAAPKVELYKRLRQLAEYVQEGKYDN